MGDALAEGSYCELSDDEGAGDSEFVEPTEADSSEGVVVGRVMPLVRAGVEIRFVSAAPTLTPLGC